ncbi:MAG: hypothetical protein N3E51_02955 [Candidatus Micrarchaeota archaeon]|nr:hypothetical protein [Candidatus Micrarchaeota archaeon]
MAKMNVLGAKRGVIFTLMVMMFSALLLSFAVALAEQSSKSRQTAVALLEIDQVADAYSNIEDNLARIMSSSMNMSVRNNTLLINATLPPLRQTAADFENYAEFVANTSDLNISMNLSELSNFSVVVQPKQARISQDDANFRLVPFDSRNVRAYDINITYPTAGIDAAAWQKLSEAQDGIPVHIRVQDARHSVNLDFYATLDREGESILNITQAGSLKGEVRFLPSAALRLWHDGNIGLKASFGFSTPVYVESNDTVWVNSSANKTGRVRLA